MMNVINYFESDRQAHWLEQIRQCDWPAGVFLYELLSKETFFDAVGKRSEVLLLIDADVLISFCTYAEKDDIQSTELTPWVGFVYTFPAFRGHRCLGKLFDKIEQLAEKDGFPEVYISTHHHIGLYEKYGCVCRTQMTDIGGNPSRVYVRKTG